MLVLECFLTFPTFYNRLFLVLWSSKVAYGQAIQNFIKAHITHIASYPIRGLLNTTQPNRGGFAIRLY